MTLGQYINNIISGTYSLATGLGVTIRYMFKPISTVQYPRERIEMSAAFRGPIELVTDQATGKHNCVACGICAKTCPSLVITVEGSKKKAPAKKSEGEDKGLDEAKPPAEAKAAAKGKGAAKEDLFVVTEKFIIDFSRCSLCGLCVESCPRKALKFSQIYDEVGESRQASVYDLIARQESALKALGTKAAA